MSKKVVIILIIGVMLVLGMFGAGFFIMWQKMTAMGTQNAQASAKVNAKKKQVPAMGPTFHLDPFIVNLADSGGKRFLRLTMELEVKNAEVQKELEKSLPRVQDAILTILPSKKYADLHTTQGKVALRQEILKKLNSFLPEKPVTHVYFTEFVIQ